MKAIELKDKLTYHQYKILMSALAFFEANKDADSISCTLHPRRKSGRKKVQKKDKLDITIDEKKDLTEDDYWELDMYGHITKD